MLAGFSRSSPKKLNEIIKLLFKQETEFNLKMTEINPVLAVTLADLFGVTAPFFTEMDKEYGKSAEWNSTICHTDLLHFSDKNLWATMAQLRGGIDGYNIGRQLKMILKTFPNITASQMLRFYYSKEGIFNIGICNRHVYIDDLLTEIFDEVRKFLIIWNKVYFDDQYEKIQMDSWISNQFIDEYTQLMRQATVQNLGNYLKL